MILLLLMTASVKPFYQKPHLLLHVEFRNKNIVFCEKKPQWLVIAENHANPAFVGGQR